MSAVQPLWSRASTIARARVSSPMISDCTASPQFGLFVFVEAWCRAVLFVSSSSLTCTVPVCNRNSTMCLLPKLTAYIRGVLPRTSPQSRPPGPPPTRSLRAARSPSLANSRIDLTREGPLMKKLPDRLRGLGSALPAAGGPGAPRPGPAGSPTNTWPREVPRLIQPSTESALTLARRRPARPISRIRTKVPGLSSVSHSVHRSSPALTAIMVFASYVELATRSSTRMTSPAPLLLTRDWPALVTVVIQPLSSPAETLARRRVSLAPSSRISKPKPAGSVVTTSLRMDSSLRTRTTVSATQLSPGERGGCSCVRSSSTGWDASWAGHVATGCMHTVTMAWDESILT
mmetsp:Transcript_13715/g.39003  ORF Transcript_13715/g.39003 Transcript_13715/m.39003 type:complete len:346 (+) Transcript_13715:388-1425(+)